MSLPVDRSFCHSTPLRVSKSLGATFGDKSWSSAFETPEGKQFQPPVAAKKGSFSMEFDDEIEEMSPSCQLSAEQKSNRPPSRGISEHSSREQRGSQLSQISSRPSISPPEMDKEDDGEVSLDETLPSQQVFPVVVSEPVSHSPVVANLSRLDSLLGIKPKPFVYPPKSTRESPQQSEAPADLWVDCNQKPSSAANSPNPKTPSPASGDFTLTDGRSAYNATTVESRQEHYETLEELLGAKTSSPLAGSQQERFRESSQSPIAFRSPTETNFGQPVVPSAVRSKLGFFDSFLLDGLDQFGDLSESGMSEPSFGGFSNGFGNKILISNAAIQRAEKSMCETPTDGRNSVGFKTPTAKLALQGGTSGFATGSGKSLTISEAMGDRTNRLAGTDKFIPVSLNMNNQSATETPKFGCSKFKPVVITPVTDRSQAGFLPPPIASFSGGFKSGSGRIVTPSPAAMDRAMKFIASVHDAAQGDSSSDDQSVPELVKLPDGSKSDIGLVPSVPSPTEKSCETISFKRKNEWETDEESKRRKNEETPSDGLSVPLVYFIVLRVYPVKYMEKCEDGGCIFRCKKLEELEGERYNESRQILTLQLKEDLRAELLNDPAYSDPLADDEEAADLWKKSLSDPDSTPVWSESQIKEWNRLNDRVSLLQLKMFEDRWSEVVKTTPQLQPRSSKVRPMVKLLIRCLDKEGAVNAGETFLTLWSDSLVNNDDESAEGRCFYGYNLRVQSARRAGATEQFSFGKESSFEPAPKPPDYIYNQLYQQRRLLSLKDVVELVGHTRESNEVEREVDVLGFVVEVISGGNVDTVQLGDLSGLFVCVKFWNGLQVVGGDRICRSGSVVVLQNLQLRKSQNSGSPIPILSASEFTDVSSSLPDIKSYRNLFSTLKNNIVDIPDLMEKAKINLRSVIGQAKSNGVAPVQFHKSLSGQMLATNKVGYGSMSQGSSSTTPLRTSASARPNRMGPKLLFNGRSMDTPSQNVGAPLKLESSKADALRKPFRVPVGEISNK